LVDAKLASLVEVVRPAIRVPDLTARRIKLTADALGPAHHAVLRCRSTSAGR